MKRAGSLDSDLVRGEILKLKTKTVFGDFAVDERGFQIGHKTAIVQWRDGKKVREAAHRGGARVSGGDSGARQGGARIGGTAAVRRRVS